MPRDFTRRQWLILHLAVVLSPAVAIAQLDVARVNNGYSLSAPGLGDFYSTSNEVRNARLIPVPGSAVQLALWEEKLADGRAAAFYAISLDGQRIARLRQTSYEILLRYDRFDPLLREPEPPDPVAAKNGDPEAVYIVQFVTQPLEEFRQQIRALGGTIYKFLASHAYLVKMDPAVRDQVAVLPFVRWVGLYHPAYRLEEYVLARLSPNGLDVPELRYNIQVFERGVAQQNRVAQRIQDVGGTVHLSTPLGYRLEATLDADGLLKVAKMAEVQFIDRWSPPEADVTTAREIGGADFIESTLGFTGEDVRGEVMDVGVRRSHLDFQSRPLLVHGATPPVASHGTSTTGIVFGDGTADIRGRGFLPSGQGIVAVNSEARRRYEHTAELLQEPYFAVFQSNSWGDGLTTQYTTVSAEMDDILFLNDILIAQSQSNAGSQNSRPQAWAKNIVSVGGINHYGTVTMDDDCWCRGGSIGPAADGRIKPDLAHFYDRNFTPSGNRDDSYDTGFGGTSAATPIVAGHFGLFFEMWHKGIFGNPTGATVFDSRPHMATSKAVIINTAKQWQFSGSTHDLTRTHQGWGIPDLENLYNLRDKIFIVNQTDVLRNLESKIYTLQVEGATPLRATLVYTDLGGTTSSTLHRINDLTLKVTSPSKVVYWGNNGLLSEMWSAPAGEPDTKNTVENVFIENPEPGTWTVEVIASEINEDEHPDTPEVDADYALVVSGVALQASLR